MSGNPNEISRGDVMPTSRGSEQQNHPKILDSFYKSITLTAYVDPNVRALEHSPGPATSHDRGQKFTGPVAGKEKCLKTMRKCYALGLLTKEIFASLGLSRRVDFADNQVRYWPAEHVIHSQYSLSRLFLFFPVVCITLRSALAWIQRGLSSFSGWKASFEWGLGERFVSRSNLFFSKHFILHANYFS